jgi:GAF domain-containing protein
MVPFDSIAVYAVRSDVIFARFALGENARQLSSLRVPMGQGLIGWVAETGNYIINGNPTVEPGLDGLKSKLSLRSALAVPLIKGTRTIGVLALYGLNTDAFTPEHLNVVQASAKYLVDIIAEKLDVEESLLASRSGWRPRVHLGSRIRDSVSNELPVFTSIK